MKFRKVMKRLRARQKDYEASGKTPDKGFKKPGSNTK